MSLQTWSTRKQYDKKSKKRENFTYLFTFQLSFLPYFPYLFTIQSNSCWFRMFIGKLSVLQVHIVVGFEYSWAIMTNLGHITGPLWRHPFINTIMLILLSQNEQGISALDLQKHIFPSPHTKFWMNISRSIYIEAIFKSKSHSLKLFGTKLYR
jgi:hypothetical protein